MLSDIEYKIIEDCKCGYEELFILISLIPEGEEKKLFTAIINLCEQKLLACRYKNNPQYEPTLNELMDYLNKRKKTGEELETYPEVCEEYEFIATESGIDLLKEDDKPIRKRN
ncbi:MAG: hypothetical protein AB1414_04625 [bacterium]